MPAGVISHTELIEKMQALGYRSNAGGICYGFATMAARAAMLYLAGDKEALPRFYQRLAEIHALPLEAFKNKSVPSDILAFFDGIELFHQAYLYPALFGGADLHLVSTWPLAEQQSEEKRAISITYPCYIYVKEDADAGKEEQLLYLSAQGEVTEIPQNNYATSLLLDLEADEVGYKRLSTQEAKQFAPLSQDAIPKTQSIHAAPLLRPIAGEALVEAERFSGAYKIKDLENYFARLAEHAERTQKSLVLMLDRSNHTIMVMYDCAQKKWLLMDAEKGEKIGQYIAGEKGIAKEVFSSLSKNDVAIFTTRSMQVSIPPLQEIVSDLLTVNPEKAQWSDSDGANLLYIAALEGDIALMDSLLAQGVDIHNVLQNGSPPLYIAAQQGHAAIVEWFLMRGVDPDQVNNDGFTPLYIAAQMGEMAVLESLLTYGATVDKTEKNGATALHVASLEGHAAIVEKLLEKGANMWARCNRSTPLDIAKKHSHTEVEKILQAHVKKQNLLFAAAQKGELEPIVDALEENAEKVLKQVNAEGNSLLHVAIEKGHVRIVDALLKAGADLHQKDSKGTAPLWIAMQCAQPNIYALICKYALAAAQDTDKASLASRFALITQLETYIKAEPKQTRSAFFCICAPRTLPKEAKKAAYALLQELTEKEPDMQQLQPLMKACKTDKALQKIYQSACDLLSLSIKENIKEEQIAPQKAGPMRI